MKLTIGIAVALALLAGAFLFFYSTTLFAPITPPQTETAELNLYASGALGISFPYPATYLVSEGERGTPERPHYAIVLTDEEDADLPIGGEGPITISIDAYPASGTLRDWITTAPESNFRLGPQTYTEAMVDGVEALSYRWSGLYEGETTAFLHEGNVIAVSVTYLSPEDSIVSDYRMLVKNLSLAR